MTILGIYQRCLRQYETQGRTEQADIERRLIKRIEEGIANERVRKKSTGKNQGRRRR